jgi:flavorubredoxin
MPHGVQAVKVTDSVYWVGAIDWNIRDFHGYLTSRGTTYNAYLVIADKITLIDTVKRPYFEEMMARIASVIDPSQIEVVVSNHSEMDHSGSLPETLAAVRPERVYASTMGVKTLGRHFKLDQEVTPVKEGETLSLGNRSLTFLETKMLHWPDSMFAYMPEEEVLFSQDAFGMHLATSERFDDQIDDWVLNYEAAKYYANILMPFSPLVLKLLEKVKGLNLPLQMILPDHGPIWRGDWGRIVNLYATWAAQAPTRKAVVTYDTMWNSTAAMARAYAEGLQAGGACVRVMPIGSCHRSNLATEVLDAGALVVGSPTINGQMFPTVADSLCYLRGLKRQNLIGGVFGSYGWSGEATGQVADIMTDMKVDLIGEPVKAQYVPDEAALNQCFEAGLQIAQRLLPLCACSCEKQ